MMKQQKVAGIINGMKMAGDKAWKTGGDYPAGRAADAATRIGVKHFGAINSHWPLEALRLTLVTSWGG